MPRFQQLIELKNYPHQKIIDERKLIDYIVYLKENKMYNYSFEFYYHSSDGSSWLPYKITDTSIDEIKGLPYTVKKLTTKYTAKIKAADRKTHPSRSDLEIAIIKNLDRKLAEITPPKVAFPVAIAGGSSIPEGFFKLFQKKLNETKLKIDLSHMKLARDPLYSVARGCLIAARTQEAGKKLGAATQKKAESKPEKEKKS